MIGGEGDRYNTPRVHAIARLEYLIESFNMIGGEGDRHGHKVCEPVVVNEGFHCLLRLGPQPRQWPHLCVGVCVLGI